MAAVASDEATRICSHCTHEEYQFFECDQFIIKLINYGARAILVSNIDMHYAHCSRNLEKCKLCGDMIPKRHAEEHFLNTHAPVSCSMCSEKMDRDIISIHEGEKCPQRIITCMFCEFPLPAIDLPEHQEACGNRTELCSMCNRYIHLREKFHHESWCCGMADPIAEPTRDAREAESERAPRSRSSKFFPGRLVLNIAVVGIAVLLSSLLYQRKSRH